MKLIRLLYRAAIGASAAARSRLAEGDIRGRTREINRAWAILQELSGSLDRAGGGEIGFRLAGLYAYMQQRLIEANTTQSAGPLEEVERLLITVNEAWEAVEDKALAEVEDLAAA